MNTAAWLQTAVLSGLVGCAPVIGEVTGIPTDTAAPHTDPPDECGAWDLPILRGNGSYSGPDRYQICLDIDDADTCPTGESALFAVRERVGSPEDPDFCWYDISDVCGPVQLDDTPCCFAAQVEVMCEGRPLSTDAGARTAALQEGAGWSGQTQILGDLSPEQAGAAATHWRNVALAEHASIASFARVVLELCALGAPADLVTDAVRAQADEVRHSKLAFSLLSEASGTAITPGPLRLDDLQIRTEARQILRATILEGCINETLSAAEVKESAERCTHPALAHHLRDVAIDEARHASLAWRTVSWLIEQHPELRDEAKEIVRAHLARPVSPTQRADRSAHAHRIGSLRPAERQAIFDHVDAQVIRRAAERVLGPIEDLCAAA
ncbi:MAG: ferritin-like domain-containing protein [Myxococcota bacterium]